MKNNQKSKTVLGIDYGQTNIGLALGVNNLAVPLRSINGKNWNEAISNINKVIIENKIDLIVIGLPLNANNKETQMSLEVRRFTNTLKGSTKKQVVYVNEYLSSAQALETALESDVSQKRRRQIDSISAAIIVKNYFESSA